METEVDPFDKALAKEFEKTIGEIGRWTETGDLRWIVDNTERYSKQFAEAARRELLRRGLL